MRGSKLFFIFPIFILWGCSNQEPVRDYAAEIEAANVSFEEAYNRGDAQAVASLYTENAIIMPPGQPLVHGPIESLSIWQAMMDSGLARLDLIEGEVIGFNDFAANQGTFVGYDAEGNQIATGKFHVFWIFENGEWKLHHDIWNLDS